MSEILNQQIELPTLQSGNSGNTSSSGPIATVVEIKWLTDYTTLIANHYTSPDGKNDRALLVPSGIIRGNYFYPRFEVRKSAANYINPINKKVNRDTVLIAPFDHMSFLAFLDACKKEILKGTNETITVATKNYDYVNNVKTDTISIKAYVTFGLDNDGYYIIVKSPTDTDINHFNKFYIRVSDFIDISKNSKKMTESYVISWLDNVKEWVMRNKYVN